MNLYPSSNAKISLSLSPFKRPTRANSSSAGSGSTSTGEAIAVNSKLSETSPTVTVNTPAYSPSA